MIKKVCFIVLALLFSSQAYSDVSDWVDNGTYMTDTSTRLEWLKLTETSQYPQLTAQLFIDGDGIGGPFDTFKADGWVMADVQDVRELLGQLFGSPFPDSLFGVPAADIQIAFNFFGITHNVGGDVFGEGLAFSDLAPPSNPLCQPFYQNDNGVTRVGSYCIPADVGLNDTQADAGFGFGIWANRPVATPSPAEIRAIDSEGDPNDLIINFGNVLVSNSSIETVTVTNEGDLSLDIGSVVSPSVPFSVVSDSCSNISLLIGGCNIAVQFLPTAAGPFADTLAIPSNDTDEPVVTVTLTGTGVSSPFTPEISVTPIDLFFNSIIAGNLSLPMEVTISNIGTGVLNVSNMSFTGGTDFSLNVNGGSNPCGHLQPIIIAGSSCTISVSFEPQSTGIFFDTLSISHNDPNEPTIGVSLSGNGVSGPTPDLAVSPLTHDFLDVIVGNPSPPLELVLSNIDNFDVHVSAMSLATGTHYSLNENGGTNPCGSLTPTIAAQSSCTVSITFTPFVAWEMHSDTLTIFSDDANEPTIGVSLTGGGVGGPTPDISVSPMLLGFSDNPFGSLPVTISNVGSANLHVSDISLTNPPNPFLSFQDYTLKVDVGPNACLSASPTITPGGSCTVEIEARLGRDLIIASIKTYEETLVITSDDWNEPEVRVEIRSAVAGTPIDDDDDGCEIASMSSPEKGIPVVPIVFLLLLIQGLWVWRKMRRR